MSGEIHQVQALERAAREMASAMGPAVERLRRSVTHTREASRNLATTARWIRARAFARNPDLALDRRNREKLISPRW